MAEGREYVIRIEYGDVPDDSDVGQSPIAQPPGKKQPGTGTKVSKALGAAVGVAQPFINTAMQMHTNKITTITGSQQLAKRQALINSTAQGVMSMAQSGLSGASVAAAFGAATGVGAVVGIAMAAVQKVMEIAVRAEDIANKMEVESTQLNVTRARAGIAYNRSRSGRQ